MNWHLLRSGELAQRLPSTPLQARAIVVMPSTDAALAQRAAQFMAKRAGVDDALVLAVLDDERAGFVDIANRVFRQTESEFFGYVAQDAFAGRNWLKIAIDTLEARQKDLLAFNDGKWGGVLAAFGLGRRRWLAGNYGGDLFCADYTQHYADTELTVLAIGNERYAYNPQAVLVEVDWAKDQAAVNPLDKLLFAQRKVGCLRERVIQHASLEIFK